MDEAYALKIDRARVPPLSPHDLEADYSAQSDMPRMKKGQEGWSEPWCLCPGSLPVALSLLLAALLPSQALPQESPPAVSLQESGAYLSEIRGEIEALAGAHRGVVGVSVLDPNTGESFGLNEDEPFPSASLVKMGVMIDVFARVKEGTLTLESPLIFLDGDRTGGSGLLQYLTAPKEITVWDAVVLMITVSDNTATNLLLEKLRVQPVNERMRSLGLEKTRIFSPVNVPPGESFAPDSAAMWGLGVTTPREMTRLLSHLYHQEIVDAEASQSMIAILGRQIFYQGIPRHLPDGVQVAHKTGAVEGARNDCGIIYSGELDFILCVMTRENEDQRWGMDNEAYSLIADVSLLVYDELHRLYLESAADLR